MYKILYLLTSKMVDFLLLTWLWTNYCITCKTTIGALCNNVYNRNKQYWQNISSRAKSIEPTTFSPKSSIIWSSWVVQCNTITCVNMEIQKGQPCNQWHSKICLSSEFKNIYNWHCRAQNNGVQLAIFQPILV